ncbi:hypothetical protein PQX77_008815 [Marasmius sp. AFHP31]|nr:hypothetical protein PQX77_008815 [Marasmius sp. AFHP31]
MPSVDIYKKNNCSLSEDDIKSAIISGTNDQENFELGSPLSSPPSHYDSLKELEDAIAAMSERFRQLEERTRNLELQVAARKMKNQEERWVQLQYKIPLSMATAADARLATERPFLAGVRNHLGPGAPNRLLKFSILIVNIYVSNFWDSGTGLLPASPISWLPGHRTLHRYKESLYTLFGLTQSVHYLRWHQDILENITNLLKTHLSQCPEDDFETPTPPQVKKRTIDALMEVAVHMRVVAIMNEKNRHA